MWRRAWWLLVGVLLGIMAVSASAFAQTPWGFGGTAQMLPWGTGAGNTTELRFYELVAGGANYRGLKAPDALTGNVVWTLPATDTAGCLQSDGAGVLSITACPGGGNVSASGTLTLNRIILGAGTTTVSALGTLGTTTTVLHGNAAGAPTFGAVALATDVSGILAEANFPALNGDGTTSAGSLTFTLSNSGVSAGTYGQVTVDAKGRATAGTIIADVAHGGSGAATFTIHGVLLGNTTSAFGVTAEGATGTVLGGVTGANPAFTATPAVTSVTTSGQGAIVIGPYGAGVGNTGELRFLELAASGGNYRGFKAADALTGNLIWTLPTADGAAGECLATDGSGVLSWGACSAGSGTGITSLNGLNAAVQTFANDTNVTMVSASSTHTITWSGLLGVTRGGTGAATLTSHGVLFGAGTSAVTASAEGATGTVLQGATGSNAGFTATPTITTLNTTGNPGISLGPWGAAAGNTGWIRFLELAANGTNFVALKAADNLASNVTWTLPSSDGAPSECLTTSGGGVLSFSPCASNSAPADATYLTMALNGSLSNERVATAGFGITLADGGANSTATFSVNLTQNFDWTGRHSYAASSAITLLPWGAGAGQTSPVLFRELAANGTNSVALKAPDNIASDVVWTLPSADASGCVQSNGAGALSISTCPGGLTGSGVASRVAYWSGASALTSSANMTFDGNDLTLGRDLKMTAATFPATIPVGPRIIVTEAGGVPYGNIQHFPTYQRMILNDLTNATKTGIYIESVAAGTVFSVTSLTRTGSTANLTTSASHNLRTGDLVQVRGAAPSAYNVTNGTITVTGVNTFTYAVSGSPSTPATGTITTAQSRVGEGIIVFGFSQSDNGHDASLITSTSWGNGNAATFQRVAGGSVSPPAGLPALLDPLSRQYGFAVEVNSYGNTTAYIGGNHDNGLSMALSVGNLPGPPWAEGLLIYPRADATNLASRIALRVTKNQDNLVDTNNDAFRVAMSGQTTITATDNINNQLEIIGTAANGAGIHLVGNSGSGTPGKYIQSKDGRFVVSNDAYTQLLLAVADNGQVQLPQMTGGGSVSLCIDAVGTLFRGSPGC